MPTPLRTITALAPGGLPFSIFVVAIDPPGTPCDHAFALPDGQQVYLETDDGWTARRVERGLYELLDLPGFLLISHDPEAP